MPALLIRGIGANTDHPLSQNQREIQVDYFSMVRVVIFQVGLEMPVADTSRSKGSGQVVVVGSSSGNFAFGIANVWKNGEPQNSNLIVGSASGAWQHTLSLQNKGGQITIDYFEIPRSLPTSSSEGSSAISTPQNPADSTLTVSASSTFPTQTGGNPTATSSTTTLYGSSIFNSSQSIGSNSVSQLKYMPVNSS